MMKPNVECVPRGEALASALMLACLLIGPVVNARTWAVGAAALPLGALVLPWTYALTCLIGQVYGLDEAFRYLGPVILVALTMATGFWVMARLPDAAGETATTHAVSVWANNLSFRYTIAAFSYVTGSVGAMLTVAVISRVVEHRVQFVQWWLALCVAQLPGATLGTWLFHVWWLHEPFAQDVLRTRLAFVPVMAAVMTCLTLPVTMWMRAHIPLSERRYRIGDFGTEDQP